MRGSIEKRRLHVERVCVNVNFDLNPLFNMMCVYVFMPLMLGYIFYAVKQLTVLPFFLSHFRYVHKYFKCYTFECRRHQPTMSSSP